MSKARSNSTGGAPLDDDDRAAGDPFEKDSPA
jgi:hypothetical protein